MHRGAQMKLLLAQRALRAASSGEGHSPTRFKNIKRLIFFETKTVLYNVLIQRSYAGQLWHMSETNFLAGVTND